MPTQIKITNGPPFKVFMFKSHFMDDHRWLLTFEFDGQNHRKKDVLSILAIGKKLGEKDGDQYCFFAHRQECAENWDHYFYAGRYNTRERTGGCTVFTQEELSMCPLAKAMFG